MKVFYTPRQTVSDNLGFSPSARKPAEVVASWRALGVPLEIVEPEPATVDELALAHDRAYVEGVLAGRVANGFGNRLRSVAASLPWTVGSFRDAALHAFRTGETTASPTSGFHHARWGGGHGFCTFNGLMAARVLLRAGARRVGILDADQHYGDGTADILAHLARTEPAVTAAIRHHTFGAEPITPDTAEDWLARWPDVVRSFGDCDVILYQAGADPHISDPLGGTLTTEQLARRDRIVFEVARQLGVPVAWNLAGGYQEPLRRVLDLHDTTMRIAVEVSGVASREPKQPTAPPPRPWSAIAWLLAIVHRITR
ncbi:MAG: histone deacetylase [Alphaproteobacteria bacterium]|nr:histone deacetylase [Alphaproteobacteria bacterium]